MHSNILRKAIVLCFLFLHVSFASVPKDISFFADKPSGIAKDFYIYEYLQSENASKEDAQKLLEQTSYMSLKLFHQFAKKLEDEGISKVSNCMSMETKTLLAEDRDCIAIGLSVYEATLLEKKRLQELAQELSLYKESIALHVLSHKDVYKRMMEGNLDEFFETFNAVGAKYRQNFFDKPIPKNKIDTLCTDSRFNQTIKFVITDNKLLHVNKSFLHVSPQTATLTHQSLFYLGLNALKLKEKKIALAFFDAAYEKAYYRMDKDKVLFWKHLITNDARYKKELEESFDLNIYTLLAGQENKRIMIAKAYEKHPSYDETDPFGWTQFLSETQGKTPQELENLAQFYLYGSTLGHFSLLMERASGSKDHYFPLPYKQYLDGYKEERIALILALARQESRFIPSAISRSYALGLMQFMPFLANAIAKEKNFLNFELEDMFKPESAYMFANIHLDYLEKYLHNPLFIAYAYNGGIGFTKRLLKAGSFSKGAYEPYMSMELVAYDESREYGKKVLANYVTYMKILGKKVSIKKLLEEAMDPNKSDAFR